MKSENTPLEHQNVPVTHQGLHSFLYGSDNEHQAETAVEITSEGTNIMEVSQWEQQTGNSKIAGVYAVIDSDRMLFIISSNIKLVKNSKFNVCYSTKF